MKAFTFLFLAAGVAMLPTFTIAAKKGKSGGRHGGHHGSSAVEALNAYDKNANHKIDADELPLLQKAFSAMRTVDKNGDAWSCRTAKRFDEGALGNIFDGTLALAAAPSPCTYDICPCSVPANRGMIE